MPVFTIIDHQELTGTAASWVKSSISQSYDHLLILASVRSNRAATYDSIKIGFNNNSTAGDYGHTSLLAYTSSVASGYNVVQAPTFIGDMAGGNNLADVFASLNVWVPNYSNTTNYTQALSHLSHSEKSTSNGEWGEEIDSIQFKSTAAITEVSLHTNTGSFVEYSTFTLFGVKGA